MEIETPEKGKETLTARWTHGDKYFQNYMASDYRTKACYKICGKPSHLRDAEEAATLEAFVARYLPYGKAKARAIANMLFCKQFQVGQTSMPDTNHAAS